MVNINQVALLSLQKTLQDIGYIKYVSEHMNYFCYFNNCFIGRCAVLVSVHTNLEDATNESILQNLERFNMLQFMNSLVNCRQFAGSNGFMYEMQ